MVSTRTPGYREASASSMRQEVPTNTALLAYPMHGQRKLTTEGYRTRDGHLIEWFGRLTTPGAVAVISRPEPVLGTLFMRGRRAPEGTPAAGTTSVSRQSLKVPNPRNPKAWWKQSRPAYPDLQGVDTGVPAIVWNPFLALGPANSSPFAAGRRVLLDLLDDWTIHHAFAPIRRDVELAYAHAFETAHSVTANSEGTQALAQRFGRPDVRLVPNGVDPERFAGRSAAAGAPTIGYIGKIGSRIDLLGILETARALPRLRFVIAGPFLESGYRGALEAEPNISVLGDVHYSKIPALLHTFDVGWVPHSVGPGEVGGDAIKIYEYRAAGLPVLTTAIAGTSSRGLDHVSVLPIGQHAAWLTAALAGQERSPRYPALLPPDHTWEVKARLALSLMGLGSPGESSV